jgi:hypothetical protein
MSNNSQRQGSELGRPFTDLSNPDFMQRQSYKDIKSSSLVVKYTKIEKALP